MLQSIFGVPSVPSILKNPHFRPLRHSLHILNIYEKWAVNILSDLPPSMTSPGHEIPPTQALKLGGGGGAWHVEPAPQRHPSAQDIVVTELHRLY